MIFFSKKSQNYDRPYSEQIERKVASFIPELKFKRIDYYFKA